MSFGLGRGRPLDAAPGVIGVAPEELPPLPDDILANRRAAWIDPGALFRDPERPIEIEIGPGKGAFLLAQAEADPDTNYLAIEWAGEFYAYAADRVRRRGLTNVRLLHADAREFLGWRMPSESVRVLHLYFSDPWPKTRHHKHRVVQDAFLAHAWRVLEPADPRHAAAHGELRIVTDHDGYWAWIAEHLDRWTSPKAWPLLEQLAGVEMPTPAPAHAPYTRQPFTPPGWAQRGELVGTNFERKFLSEGRSFHSSVLRKVTMA